MEVHIVVYQSSLQQRIGLVTVDEEKANRRARELHQKTDGAWVETHEMEKEF